MLKLFDSKINSKYDVFTLEKGHNKVTYRGLPLRKCPFDYVIYQMIIFEVQPDLIIEIGTDKGGSALYMADLLNVLGKGIIHTIDIKDELENVVKSHNKIKPYFQGWQNYNFDDAKGFEKVLIIEDSTHYYKDTLDILNLFSGLVSRESYFIVEDGVLNLLGWEKKYDGGPVKAINEFVKSNDNFKIDSKWINFFGENATFNLNGYLKKIR